MAALLKIFFGNKIVGVIYTLKTRNGLARASIKTINGLAIASLKDRNGLT